MQEKSSEELYQMIDEYIKNLEEKEKREARNVTEKKDVKYKVKTLGKHPLDKS